MKKLFTVIAVICALALTSFSVSSCVEKHIDASVSLNMGKCSYSGNRFDPKPGVTADEISTFLNNELSKQNGDYMSTGYLVIRDQSKYSSAKKKAEKIANNLQKALEAEWPNLSSDLSADYKALSFVLTFEFDSKEATVWDYTIR